MMRTRLITAFALAAAAVPSLAAGPTFSTQAPVAYLVDLSSGAELYVKDADRRIPPASMAKMMTAHVAFSMIASGKLRLDQTFTVKPETWQKWHGPEAGSTMFLSPGETVSVENLLHGIVTLSGNDACIVLAEGMFGSEAAFVTEMNRHAGRLGLTNTRYGTANGWPDGGKTYTTARDLAKLGRATIETYPELYRQFYGMREFSWGKTNGGKPITQPNRNPLLGAVEGADGIKTGHTEEAGYGFTGSAAQNGRRLVMVVAGVDSFNNRITESVKLMRWGFEAWATKPIAARGARVGSVAVQGGMTRVVDVTTPRAVSVTLPMSTENIKVSAKIVYQGPVKAPIAKGQHIADLVITASDNRAQITPLVAAESVSEAGFFGRVWMGLLSFLPA